MSTIEAPAETPLSFLAFTILTSPMRPSSTRESLAIAVESGFGTPRGPRQGDSLAAVRQAGGRTKQAVSMWRDGSPPDAAAEGGQKHRRAVV